MAHYALIGRSLAHSFSRTYFTDKFRLGEIDSVYENIEFDRVERLREFLRSEHHFSGFNVTIPYKSTVLALMDAVDPIAQATGAVNCIKCERGKLYGFNTDVPGFRDALANWYPDPPGARGLIFGTGGAARAAWYALRHFYSFDSLYMVSRSPEGPDTIGYEQLWDEGIGEVKLLVNATPLGMFPNLEICPDIPYEQLGSDHYVYDMVYNPETTLYLRKAHAQKSHIQNGMEMLIRQAELSYRIWQAALPSDLIHDFTS